MWEYVQGPYVTSSDKKTISMPYADVNKMKSAVNMGGTDVMIYF